MQVVAEKVTGLDDSYVRLNPKAVEKLGLISGDTVLLKVWGTGALLPCAVELHK